VSHAAAEPSSHTRGHAPGHGHDHHAEVPGHLWPPDEHFGKASVGKIGMWIFLLSDALMFAGLLLGYGILRGGADVWRHAGEPDYGINFTAMLTFLLICSSVTMVLAFAACVENDRKKMVMWLGLTALGGALFLVGQYHEYFGIWHPGLTKRGLIFGDSAYASCFYVVTSFHGLHVFSGVVLLLITTFNAWRGKFDNGNYNTLEIVGLFWHFVDLVWIIVFTVVYLIPTDVPAGMLPGH
jgi:cytochrome c oxidase subunit III